MRAYLDADNGGAYLPELSVEDVINGDEVVVLTKLEAQALYHQLKAEWLDRDFYNELQSAMRKLDI